MLRPMSARSCELPLAPHLYGATLRCSFHSFSPPRLTSPPQFASNPLTIRRNRRSVLKLTMQLARNTRTWTPRLSAALVVILVLVPSLCTARCSSHLCAPVLPQSAAENCHHASASNSSAGSNLAASPEPCASSEILSTAPRSNSAVSAADSAGTASFCAPSALDLSALQPFAADVPPLNGSPHSSPPVLSVPLRI